MKYTRRARRLLAFALFLTGASSQAQLRDIDATRLPQLPKVQAAYAELLPIESYVQGWQANWKYPVAKRDVVAKLTDALNALASAEKADPENHELQLLTGLVAHFAYNVDIDPAYDVAMNSLQAATISDATDIRPQWFLGIHQCQSATDGNAGMERLLAIEKAHEPFKLPIDFWNDYMTCATTTNMPAHTLRSIGYAIHAGAPPQSVGVLKGMAEKRYRPSDDGESVATRDAWTSDKDQDKIVFTSYLCGVSFIANGNWQLQLPDVQHGVCTAVLTPPAYPAKHGDTTANFLLLVRPAKKGESLADFVQAMATAKYPNAAPASGLPCPAADCLELEILKSDMYAEGGGAHLQAVAFERTDPMFDGLIFEHPSGPPKPDGNNDQPVYYHPEERFHRMSGKLYYLVIADANADIFNAANKDYKAFLSSITPE